MRLYNHITCIAVGRFLAAWLILLTLSACRTVPLVKPESPTVTVAGIRPVSLSFSSQTLGLTLKVQNPNPFDLPMQSMTFSARFLGEEFAQGHSVDRTTIPANGDALLEVQVKTALNKLALQLQSMLNQPNQTLNYDVKGVVKLANWPAAIPFNVSGDLNEQDN